MNEAELRTGSLLDRRGLIALAAMGATGWAIGRMLAHAGPIGRNVAANEAVPLILSDTEAPAIGPLSGSLRMAVFSDYRCPACRRATLALHEAVDADSDVRLLYKDWPIFGPPSERAAQVALASALQGIYPRVHRGLMAAPGTLDDTILRAVVTQAGGNWDRLLVDLGEGQERIGAQLRRHAQEANAIGLAGTPGFLAGPLLVLGALDTADFARLFAQARRNRQEGGRVGAASRFSGRI